MADPGPKESVALRRGGLRWVYAADDALVYLRESAEQVALVHGARAGHEPISIDAHHLRGIADGWTALGPGPVVTRDTVTLSASRPLVSIQLWHPPG